MAEAPVDFVAARELSQTSNDDVFWLGGRPYLPKWIADASDGDGPSSTQNHSIAATVYRFWELLAGDTFLDTNASTAAWTVEAITGGITNRLYRVSGWNQPESTPQSVAETMQLPEPPRPKISLPRSVLVRLFGAPGMIDRDEENATYCALAAHPHKLAPPYFGRFANGRLEGWMEGMRALKVRELSDPAIAVACAWALAQLHTQFSLPWSTTNETSGGTASGGQGQVANSTKATSDNPPTGTMWIQLEDWWKQAVEASFQTSHDTDRMNALNLSCLQQELEWLRTSVIPHDALMAFCHNDLLAANILVRDVGGINESSVAAADASTQENEKKIQLIDFEYGGTNYRAFDIANHFNEYAGGPPDTPDPNYEWMPSRQDKYEFCKAYLQEELKAKVRKREEQNGEHNSTTLNATADASVASQTEIESMLEEIEGFILANHLYWGLWAVNQAAVEGCVDFDYCQYAVRRIGEYWACKETSSWNKDP